MADWVGVPARAPEKGRDRHDGVAAIDNPDAVRDLKEGTARWERGQEERERRAEGAWLLAQCGWVAG